MCKFFNNKIVVIIYLLAIILYTGQGFFFEGTWFTSLAGYFILLVNLYFTVAYFSKRHKNKTLKWMIYFVLWTIVVWVLYPKQIISAYKGVLTTMTMVQYTFVIMTSVFPAIEFKKEGKLSGAFMTAFFMGMLTLQVLNFFFESSVGVFDSNQTNNLGYPIVALIPLSVIFWTRKPIFWMVVLFIFIMSLMSAKRGTILCCAVSLMIIGYTYLKENGRIKFKTIFSLALVIGILIYIGLQFLENMDYLQYRLLDTLEGNTSSRDYIYKNIIDRWSNSDLLHQLFGYGPIATTKFGNYAHNDWLEILYDFGVVGLLFYVLFIFGIYFFWFRGKNTPIQCQCAFILVFAYYVLRSSFSMCFYELDTVLVMFAFGYFIAECNTLTNKII